MPLRLALSVPRRPPGSAYKSATGARLIRALVRARTFTRNVRTRARARARARERDNAPLRGFIGDAETIRAEIGQLY
jgi:hypothetical protein